MAGQQRPERELRIGDAERTAAADELAEHYALGRLSAEEHSDRLDAVWAARTPSDLTPVFTDLPGGRFGGRFGGELGAYQHPSSYAPADRPGVGQERPRRGTGKRQGPFPDSPFGRPPFRRPPYAGPAGPLAGHRRGAARRFGMLPTVVRVALAVLLVVLVVAHLPLIVLGLVIWLVLTHQHRRSHAYRTHGTSRARC